MGTIIVLSLFAIIAGAAIFHLPRGIELFILLFPFLQPYLVFEIAGSHYPMHIILTAVVFGCIVLRTITSRKKARDIKANFFSRPVLLFLLILLPTIVFNPDIVGKNVLNFLVFFFQKLSPVYIGWMAFDSIRKGEKLIGKILKIAFCLAIFGIIEGLTKSNPLIEFFSSKMPGIDNDSVFTYALDQFRGYRIQTVFYHAYAWGGYLLILSSSYLFLVFNAKTATSFYKYGLIFLVIFFNIFFTRSRSCFLPTLIMIGAVLWIMPRNKQKTTFIGALIFSTLFALAASPALFDSFKKYFTAEDEGHVNGSSAELRTSQLLNAFTLIKNRLFTGNGFGATKKLVHDTASDTDLKGAESIWLVVLVDNGLIGVVAFIMFYTNIIRRFIKEKKKALNKDTILKIKIAIITVVCHVMFVTLTGDMNSFAFFMLYAGIFGKYFYLKINQEQEDLIDAEHPDLNTPVIINSLVS